MSPASRHPDRSTVRLVLYTRDPCHLCDVAKADLASLADRLPLEIEERDVDRRPEWRERYGEQVPVGVIDGRRVFKYRVEPAAIERAVSSRTGGCRG